MENGAFALLEQMLLLHNIYEYMIFQRHQKALLWSKGLGISVSGLALVSVWRSVFLSLSSSVKRKNNGERIQFLGCNSSYN